MNFSLLLGCLLPISSHCECWASPRNKSVSLSPRMIHSLLYFCSSFACLAVLLPLLQVLFNNTFRFLIPSMDSGLIVFFLFFLAALKFSLPSMESTIYGGYHLWRPSVCFLRFLVFTILSSLSSSHEFSSIRQHQTPVLLARVSSTFCFFSYSYIHEHVSTPSRQLHLF